MRCVDERRFRARGPLVLVGPVLAAQALARLPGSSGWLLALYIGWLAASIAITVLWWRTGVRVDDRGVTISRTGVPGQDQSLPWTDIVGFDHPDRGTVELLTADERVVELPHVRRTDELVDRLTTALGPAHRL
jgi:hypothetical protein